jgi:hypothetical protein
MAWSAAAAVSRFAASPAAEIRLPLSAAAAASVSFAGRRRFGPIAASLATSATGALLISLLVPNCLLVHG